MTILQLDSPTDDRLLKAVSQHYEPMMRVHGEINFDLGLGRAEVQLAAAVYGHTLPAVAYLPCCGALRHVPALLASGIELLFAVDLSFGSLSAGLARNVSGDDLGKLTVCHADIRQAREILPDEGVRFIFLGGNSMGDVTDVDGHLEFIAALADVLSPGGVMVFDYAGDRYAPKPDDAVTEWPETFHADGVDVAVIDRRARSMTPVAGTAMQILRITCQVTDAATGEDHVPEHAYSKLIVPDRVLTEQFAGAGLHLVNVGRVVDLSPYHHDRVRDVADLGMLGTPNCYYRATRL